MTNSITPGVGAIRVSRQEEQNPEEPLPDGIFKLLFPDEKHLFCLQKDLEKLPFFHALASQNMKEAKDRVIDFSIHETINFETFEVVWNLLHTKKRDVFEELNLSLLEDPLFFDRIHACLDFLFPGRKDLGSEVIERLHSKILRCFDVDLCICIYNAFATHKDELPHLNDLEDFQVKTLRQAFEIALGCGIVRDAIDCLIVTKTFFRGNIEEADTFFHVFHELTIHMAYFDSKHSRVAERQLELLQNTFQEVHSAKIRVLEKMIANSQKEQIELTHQHRKEDSEEIRLRYDAEERYQQRKKLAKEFLQGFSLHPILKQHKTFYANSISLIQNQLEVLCFDLLLPKQALTCLHSDQATPLQQLIAKHVLNAFQKHILKQALLDHRLAFPYRRDMVYWCTRLLAYYDFRIVDGTIQHPFQIKAALEGTLQNEDYKNGFGYFFHRRSPEELQEEIREDLRLCGMPEEDLLDPIEEVPTVSTTYLELNRGILLILKRVLKQIERIEEIPSFEMVETLINLISHYWNHIHEHYEDFRFMKFVFYMDQGKRWDLHARSPVELERLLREKLTSGVHAKFQNNSEVYLLTTVTDYDLELEEDNLTSHSYCENIMLPDPLFDQ